MEWNLGWTLMKNNLSILYVEDENNIREMLSKFIARFCKNIFLAHDGQEGLELYKQNHIDIVISDIKMPKLNGIDMVQEIKKINPAQLVIFTTAHIDSEYLFKAIELQIDGYIAKPVDLDKLKNQIDKCIIELEATHAQQQLKESEARSKIILETSQLGVFIYKEKFIYVNEVFCQMVGYTKEELYAMDSWALVSAQNTTKIKEIVYQRLEGKKFPRVHNEIPIVSKNGDTKIHRVTTDTIEYEGGYAGIGTSIDITDLLDTKERLKLLAQAMEQMDEMVRITDKDGYITYVNEALTKHTQYKKGELIGQQNNIFNSKKHDKKFYEKMYNIIEDKKSYKGVFVNAKKDGELYDEEQTITPILNEDTDEIEYYVSTSKDVTKEVKLQEQLETLATVDALTGIANRYSINKSIEDELKRAKRYNKHFSLLMFDIDFFKKVNDTHGHDIGDIVLKEFSQIISSSIRDTDMFGRWGGEEFMLLIPNEEIHVAQKLADKLRKQVKAHYFEDVEHITVSIGITHCDGHSEKEALLKRVDEALYEAKESGRDRVVAKV